MAVPQNNRHEVSVDSVTYRWTTGDDCRATIRHTQGIGAKLVIDPIGHLTPDDIADGIRYARSQGWHPTVPGPTFWLGFHEEIEPPDRFVRLAEPDEPDWKNVCQWDSGLDED